MKVLITGAGGQLGVDLVRVLQARHDCTAWARKDLDITDERAVRERIGALRPDAIVHAAAYTEVDRAETDTAGAYRVNAIGAAHVALAADACGAKLVYVSTDYVFDGTKGIPYTEQDTTRPLGVYGHSKWLGEQLVQAVCDRHFITRTSWLYGGAGRNFITKIIERADQGQDISVVDDQFGSPTYTFDLAECIGSLIESERYGVYHTANHGFCSRLEWAKTILELTGRSHIAVRPVSSDAFVLPAPRPAHSALAAQQLVRGGFGRLRDWKSALEAYIQAEWNRDHKEGHR